MGILGVCVGGVIPGFTRQIPVDCDICVCEKVLYIFERGAGMGAEFDIDDWANDEAAHTARNLHLVEDFG